jgi:formate dehydrogenase beta subunit
VAPRKVAVIGAGPAGLAAAHDLALLGYDVTVLEASEEPGGMMRFGIPEYRLPRTLIRQEIDKILALGVSLQFKAPFTPSRPQRTARARASRPSSSRWACRAGAN